MTAAIYEIRHVTSGKVYVGSTNSWKRRQTEHRAELRGGRHCNSHLQKSWTKYGEEAFVFTILEPLSDLGKIVEREQYWIDELGAAETGFNICPAAGTRRGVPHTPEHKAKISAAKMGHVQSEATKALIREKRATQVITPESIDKTRAGNTGKKRTAEFGERISTKLTGITRSAETRAKVAAANIGKKASPETRAKMSASAKAARARRAELAGQK